MKKISWILVFTFMINLFAITVHADSSVPNGSNSLQIVGDSLISSAELSQKNVHKEHYTALPENGTVDDLSGQINWSIVGNPEGVALLSCGGSKNNEVDIILYKDKLNVTTFVLKAVSPSHGTYEKTITIERNKASAISSFNITPVAGSDAMELRVNGKDSYYASFTVLNKTGMKLSYDFSIIDSSFPAEDVTSSDYNVSLLAPVSGVTVEKDNNVNNRFHIKIDRGALTASSGTFTVNLTGETVNGVSYSKKLIFDFSVYGQYGSFYNGWELDVRPVTNSDFYVLQPSGSTFINMEAVAKYNGEVLDNAEIIWSLVDNSDPKISISSNGIVSALPGAGEGKVTVQASVFSGISFATDTYDIYLVSQTTHYVDVSILDSGKKVSVEKPESGLISVPLVGKVYLNGTLVEDKNVSYTITPSNSGISVSNGKLNISNGAESGTYKITASVQGVVSSVANEAILVLYDKDDLDPLADYSIDLQLQKTVIDIPLNGKPDNTINVSVTVKKDGATVSLPYSISLHEGDVNGVSLSGNKLKVSSNAQDGFYTIVAKLDADQSIVVSKTVYVRQKAVGSSGWIILTDAVDDDLDEIIIPASGKKHIVLDSIVRSGGEAVDQPVSYALESQYTGVSIVDNIVIVDSTALAGTVKVVVSLVNNPNVKNVIEINLTGGSGRTDNYSIQVRIDTAYFTVNVPRQSEPNLNIPFIVLVRNNGIVDPNKEYEVSLSPQGTGISISGNNIIVTPNAKPGTYNIVAKLKDDSNINHAASFKLVDPNENSNIKALFLITPDELIIPQKGSYTVDFDYTVSLNGKQLEKEPVIWELLTLKDGITLSDEGKLTIAASTLPGEIWVRIKLKSDTAITTMKKIMIKVQSTNVQIPATIKITGFKDDNAQNKQIQLTKNSGDVITLKVKTFDDKGVEIFGSQVKMYLKTPVAGITVTEGTMFNEFDLYANGIYTDKQITLVAASVYNENVKVEIPVTIKKPADVNAYLSFEKNAIVRKDTFGVQAIVANNNPTKSINVVLVIALYQNNKMIDIKYFSQTIEKASTLTFRDKVVLPADVSGLTVKAFICQGDSSSTTGRLLTEPIVMVHD